MFGVHGAYRPHRAKPGELTVKPEGLSSSLLLGNGFSDLQPEPLVLPPGFNDSLIADQVLGDYQSVLTPDSSASSGERETFLDGGTSHPPSTHKRSSRDFDDLLHNLNRRNNEMEAKGASLSGPLRGGLSFPMDLEALASRLGANASASFSGRQQPQTYRSQSTSNLQNTFTNSSLITPPSHTTNPLELLLSDASSGGAVPQTPPWMSSLGSGISDVTLQSPMSGNISLPRWNNSTRDGILEAICSPTNVQKPPSQETSVVRGPVMGQLNENLEMPVEFSPPRETESLGLDYFNGGSLELLNEISFEGELKTARPDYGAVHSSFCLEDMEGLLAGSLQRGINICYECADRHCGSDRVGLYYESAEGDSSQHTFEELRDKAAQFACFLQEQGVQPGDRVASLLPRIPELMVVALATWRLGAVYLPLFTAFGPKALQYRLERSNARLVVTDLANRVKLDSIMRCPPVVMVVPRGEPLPRPQDLSFHHELQRQPPHFKPVMRCATDPFLLMFTSGTVGQPKGVYVPIKAVLSFMVYMRYCVDLRPSDVYWNASDPGWAYGLYYGVVSPLLMGNSTIFFDGRFTPDSTFRILSKYSVTNLAAAPTLFRLLVAAGKELPLRYRTCLRVANSAGEPLNPEVIRWFAEHLNCTIHDQYGQTEVGMVCGNYHGLEHPVHWGSMGLALPGYRLVALNDSMQEVGAGDMGQLAVDKAKSPLYFFQGYMDQKDMSDRSPYYLTGDRVEVSADGRFTFMGRSDDLINSAGYRIGPFDVENTLLEHPAVAESAVIGKPDAGRGELVKAFVKLGPNYIASPELAMELQRYVKKNLSSHAYPREVAFVMDLPKTPSGKIQRYILRQQELEQIDSYQE